MVNCVQAGATTLFTRGLHAYYAEQHRDTTELAIPLLRGIGYISRSDLRHRPGAAAREAAIPDAQCHGTSHMEIALSLSTEGRTPNQLARLADDFRYGTTVGPKGVDLSHVPKLEGDIVLLGAKVAEDGNGIIYQLVNYNPTPEAVYFDRQVQQCFLSEAPVTPDRLDHLVIRPHQLTAVRI
jgi:alpha-mannosidase/mannosylglycerate hydrolase